MNERELFRAYGLVLDPPAEAIDRIRRRVLTGPAPRSGPDLTRSRPPDVDLSAGTAAGVVSDRGRAEASDQLEDLEEVR